MADFTNRNADETKQFILTFDENGGSPEYTKIEDANGVDRTAEVVELLGINDKEDADSTILKEGDVEDSLNSTSTTKPLSANQGKQLNDDKASLSDVTEADSNSNGNFKKTYLTEHTGIMECWHQLSVSRTIEVTRSFAGGFRNVGDAGLWTFPQEFSSTPRIWHHLRRGEALPTRGGTTNTSFSELQIWRPDSVTTSFDLIWWVRAIGPFDDTPE